MTYDLLRAGGIVTIDKKLRRRAVTAGPQQRLLGMHGRGESTDGIEQFLKLETARTAQVFQFGGIRQMRDAEGTACVLYLASEFPHDSNGD